MAKLKDAFNAPLKAIRKGAVVTAPMPDEIERQARRERSRAAIARILYRRRRAPMRDAQRLQSAREKGRP